MVTFFFTREYLINIYRVYQHVSMNGLFLFNDALVITRRMSKHYPFSRAIEYTYKFEFSVALGRMRVHDIPESKCKYIEDIYFS